MSKLTKKQQIGVVGVDAGICWIGDPCYILHTKELPEAIGQDWGEFCDKLDEKNNFTQFNYNIGGCPGLGVCVSTGYGDGTYPVYAKFNTEGRLIKVEVDFS